MRTVLSYIPLNAEVQKYAPKEGKFTHEGGGGFNTKHLLRLILLGSSPSSTLKILLRRSVRVSSVHPVFS